MISEGRINNLADEAEEGNLDHIIKYPPRNGEYRVIGRVEIKWVSVWYTEILYQDVNTGKRYSRAADYFDNFTE